MFSKTQKRIAVSKTLASLFAAICIVFVLLTQICIFAARTAEAAPSFSYKINYQGKLMDSSGSPVADGDYDIVFKIYDPSANEVWSETDIVTVTDGLFSILLGEDQSLSGVDFYQVGMTLGINVEGDGEMTPRKEIASVPLAFVADKLDNVSSEQFLRSDAANAATLSSASTFLSLTQNGAGKIMELIGQSARQVFNAGSTGIVNVGTSTGYARFNVWGAGTGTGQIANFVNNASTSVLTILDNGYVGFGTTTPAARITVDNGGSSNSDLLLYDGSENNSLLVSNGGGIGQVTYYNSGANKSTALIETDGDTYVTYGVPNSGYFNWYANSVENMRLTTTGNLGIGTTSPYAKLSVAGKVVADNFVATSTTASSTFAYDIAVTGRISALESGTLATVIGNVTGNARGTNALDIQSNRDTVTEVASGSNSIAVGAKNTASASATLALGSSNLSSAAGATAFGNANTVTGIASVGFGKSNTVIGSVSNAFGSQNIATGNTAAAFGFQNYAHAINSVVFGARNFSGGTTGLAAVAMGLMNNQTGGTLNFTTGAISGTATGTATVGRLSSAFGILNTVSGDFGQAFGLSNTVSVAGGSAFGSYITNSVASSTQIGSGDTSKIVIRGDTGFEGFTGIGTSSPYAKLSVVGQTVAAYYTATTTSASTFPYASTTALTVSGTNGLTLGSLTGPLQAINGAVSATSTLSIAYGGTGLSTAPTFGQLLLGNANGGYTLTATSSLGLLSTTSADSRYLRLDTGNNPLTGDLTVQKSGGGSLTVSDSSSGASGIFTKTGLSFSDGDVGGISFSHNNYTGFTVSGLTAGGSATLTGTSLTWAGSFSPGAGADSTVQAQSGQTFATSNLNGGNLLLKPGAAIGTGTAATLIYGTGGGSSGTSTVNPTLVATFGFATTTLANSVLVSTGNLGIATTSPFAKLSVGGSVYFGGNLTATGTATVGNVVTTSTSASSTFAYDISLTGRLKVLESGTLATIIGNVTGDARGSGALDIQSSRSASTQVASGANSIAVGINNTASDNGVVFGRSNTTVSADTISAAVGYSNSSGDNSSAFGLSNTASGLNASAFGNGNSATGATGVSSAFGYTNTASGDASLAFGANNKSLGTVSASFGYTNIAAANGGSAFGQSNYAHALNSTVFGNRNYSGGTTGLAAVAMGLMNNQTGGTLNFTTGAITGTATGTATVGRLSSAFGILNTVSGNFGQAFGLSNTISVTGGSAFGSYITNSVASSTQIGSGDASKIVIRGDTGFEGFTGIGTTSPYAKLSVVGQVVGTNFAATSSSATSSFAGGTTFANNTVVQQTTGNLGIRTASPLANLHSLITSGSINAIFQNSNTSGSNVVQIAGTTGLDVTVVGGLKVNSNGALSLQTGSTGLTTEGTDRLTILSTGNVGIGTSSPYAKLSVDGRGVFNQDVRADYFTATSTSVASTFTYASTTVISANTICISTDCRTSWPTGGGASFGQSWEVTGGYLAPTTTLGIFVNASSTIGNGNLGLTINGTATTTGRAYFGNNIGIGTTSPYARLSIAGTAGGSVPLFMISTSSAAFSTSTALLVDSDGALILGGGTKLPNSPFHVSGNANTYLQANIQNRSNGGSASSDWVATSDIGTDSTYYVDMGINSSAYNDGAFTITGANEGYLYSQSTSLAIGVGTSSSAHALKFFTGGTMAANERMRIDSQGLVGIGTTSPYARLSVIDATTTIPVMYVGTSTGAAPLLYVSATSTGSLDWARVAIGTTTIGASGLRDQLTVAGRIYSTWRYLNCDIFGAGTVSGTTADTRDVCGFFSTDADNSDGGVSPVTDTNPPYGQLRAGAVTSAAANEAVDFRTWQKVATVSLNPVMETSVKFPAAQASTLYQVGFHDRVASANTITTAIPTNGAWFIATSTNNWIAQVRVAGVNTLFTDTGIATSTSLKKLRIELTANDANFLVDNVTVARVTGSANLPATNITLAPSISLGVLATVGTTRLLDVSYIRVWVDDPPGGWGSDLLVGGDGEEAVTVRAHNYDAVTGGNIAAAYIINNPEDFVRGKLVSIDENQNYGVRLSRGNDKNILGVVSDSYKESYGVLDDKETMVQVAFSGRAPVLVTAAHGHITAGDPITASDIAGVGMKANASGYIIGRALESYENEEENGTILVEINPQYYTGSAFAVNEEGIANANGFAVHMLGSHAVRNVQSFEDKDFTASLGAISSINFSEYRNATTGARERGILAGGAPQEILTASGDLDLTKMTVLALSGVKALDIKTAALEERIAAIEARVGSSTPIFSAEGIADAFEKLGAKISEGFAYFKNLVTENLTVGSAEKPSGITLFDEKTGKPYCVKISGGRMKTYTGTCEENSQDEIKVEDTTHNPTPSVTIDEGNTEKEQINGEQIVEEQPAPAPTPEPEPAPEPPSPEPESAPQE